MRIPRRRRSSDEPQEPKQSAEAASVDITIPRECIYKSFGDHPGPCPRCSGPLQQSHQTYMLATRRGRKKADSFVIGNDVGWFCSHCPTVIIDPEDISEFLQHSLPHWDVGNEFVLLGIVDLDAIPEEKRTARLGTDDNPYPLVEFSRVSDEAEARSRRALKTPEISTERSVAARRDSSLPFEERYEDVLQNIEFGIIRVYHRHPEMTDWDALQAVERLLRNYQAETKGRQARPPSLRHLSQQVYDSTWVMCEFRLGRGHLLDQDDVPIEPDLEPLSVDEIIACLKRIRKSINLWTREGGRQGYLTYVDQFLP